MNILIDRLPDAVEIGGEQVPINTSFFIGVQFELLMQDDKISDREKAPLILGLYYPVIPGDITTALNQVLWFYLCGKEREENEGLGGSQSAPAYSFEQDADLIFAAFLDQYGIDLNTVENLHWWKFRALFDGLTEENKISKIMGYRTMDLKGIPRTQKKHYEKLKKLYALNVKRPERALNYMAYKQKMRDYVARRFKEVASRARGAD